VGGGRALKGPGGGGERRQDGEEMKDEGAVDTEDNLNSLSMPVNTTTDHILANASNFIDAKANASVPEAVLESIVGAVLETTHTKFPVSTGYMLMLWSLYTPFFLAHIPKSTRLAVLLEIMQPSVTCLSAIGLFLCVLILGNGKDSIIALFESSAFIVYILFIAGSLWIGVYFVMKAFRNKTSSYVCCLLAIVTFFNLVYAVQAGVVNTHTIHSVSVVVGCMCVLYSVLTVTFIRMENKSIQMGWDTDADEEMLDVECLSDSDSSVHGHRITLKYCIEDVLDRVLQDIEATETILTQQSKPLPPVSLDTVPEQENLPNFTDSETVESDIEHALLPEVVDDPKAPDQVPKLQKIRSIRTQQ